MWGALHSRATWPGVSVGGQITLGACAHAPGAPVTPIWAGRHGPWEVLLGDLGEQDSIGACHVASPHQLSRGPVCCGPEVTRWWCAQEPKRLPKPPELNGVPSDDPQIGQAPRDSHCDRRLRQSPLRTEGPRWRMALSLKVTIMDHHLHPSFF